MGDPPVHIESVLVDDRSVTAPGSGMRQDAAQSLMLPPNTSRVEFRYTAVNLTSNHKSRFRYRLEGFDKSWVNAGEQHAVAYHGLRPGEYRFQVTAANDYGEWNSPGASLAFTVLPRWWQTLWFRIGGGLIVVGSLWGSRTLKLRQLRRERTRREEFSRRLIQSQEAERKRIAGELHDSLGQNLLIAKNQLYLAEELAAHADERIQPKLKQVAYSVGAALDEARAISHQLRPFQLERLGLTKAIRSMIKQTSESTKLPVELHLDSVDALLPPESEVMLYRILQEALSNILKHAHASRVRVLIERVPVGIRMVIEDDGRGFDLDAMMHGERLPGGLGLTGFEERTSLLRGKYECQSMPGQGTTLTFEIPVSEPKSK